MGNLRSVVSCCHYLGHEPVLISSPSSVSVDALIIPGVGSASIALSNLRRHNLDEYIYQVSAQQKPIIGICLGFQLLFDELTEGGVCRGLSLFTGNITSLEIPCPGYQLPRVGWAPVYSDETASKPIAEEYYFVHSYYATSCDPLITYQEYASVGSFRYLAAVSSSSNLVTGFQYHPEKSRLHGLQKLNKVLLSGFLEA